MSGEIWQEQVEIGVETTPGTAVAGTRPLYLTALALGHEREPRPKRYNVGRRDNVLTYRSGPNVVGGSASFDMGADEILEWLLMGVDGTVTPTTPGGATLTRLWTFKPASTVKTATFRHHDGANVWVGAGYQVNQITVAGSAEGGNVVTLDLFGRSRVAGSLTGSLTQRVPKYMEGWQSKIYIDALAATPGTTNKAATLIEWNVVMNNNLGRKYFADNTLSAGSLPVGMLDISATLTFEAAAAEATQMITDWNADTSKLIRLEFLGPANEIESTFGRFVTIDIPGNYTAPDLTGEGAGTRQYSVTYQGIYDPTNAFAIQWRVQTHRTAAWTAA